MPLLVLALLLAGAAYAAFYFTKSSSSKLSPDEYAELQQLTESHQKEFAEISENIPNKEKFYRYIYLSEKFKSSLK